MNAVCNTTMGIHRQKLVKVNGSFSKYKNKIEEEEKVYENTRLNQEKKRKEIEDFVNKFRAKARQASLAQSRLKMLEKMEEFEKLSEVQNLDFHFSYKECPSKNLMNIKDISFGYTKTALFSKLNFDIEKGDRIGIIGKNGKGKSTLLSVINENNKPWTGEITKHPNLAIGYFGQTNIERLYSQNTIEEEIASENTDLTLTRIRGICGTMMFSGDDAKKKIEVLSGGEKSRVLLGKILANPSNLLLLDEPTNHLDQESIEALGDQIGSFEGAVLIVTHNEELLRKMATKLLVFHHDKCELFLGTYDEFLEKIGWEDEEPASKNLKKEKMSHKDYKHERAQIIKKRSDETRQLKKDVERLESEIVLKEELVERLQNELILASDSQDGQLISEVSMKLASEEKMIDDKFELLQEKSLSLSEIENEYQKMLDELDSRMSGE